MRIPSPVSLRDAPRALWPFLLVRQIWTGAVVDDAAVRFNLRLLAVLTAVFSVPDLAEGLLTLAHASAAGMRFYGIYVTALGALELAGAVLLARRSGLGRALILVAAVGFYLEAILGLAGFERSLLSAAIFIVCTPADAWVIWFLSHPRVRRYMASTG